jgi:hypothetical protein
MRKEDKKEGTGIGGLFGTLSRTLTSLTQSRSAPKGKGGMDPRVVSNRSSCSPFSTDVQQEGYMHLQLAGWPPDPLKTTSCCRCLWLAPLGAWASALSGGKAVSSCWVPPPVARTSRIPNPGHTVQ